MDEVASIVVGVLVFFSLLLGACLYSEQLQTDRFSACMTAIQNPAECALASK